MLKKEKGFRKTEREVYTMIEKMSLSSLNGISDCGSPSKIQNGKITLAKKSTSGVGATASVKCKSGYKASDPTITCTSSGEWPSATCDLIDCGSPLKIKNGKVTLDDESSSGVGATASVKCKTGYEAVDSTIKCLSSGEWKTAACVLIEFACPDRELLKSFSAVRK
ncbi:E-selectin-like [Ruditapes philippinarum]|uniref:E-selectin-like n=1 Tax=Ruditapes philippinarum TaxID=129788 RepID=UPI00295B3E70|nr:E-selectin-like [Ruditapes philippinarum]